jgi:hypothetical protein
MSSGGGGGSQIIAAYAVVRYFIRTGRAPSAERVKADAEELREVEYASMGLAVPEHLPAHALRRPILRHVAPLGILIGLGSLALLGVLVGWIGASRAYAVGPETLFRDHLASVVLVIVVTAIGAALIGRTLVSSRELWLVIGFVIVADVVAALLVTVAIDEMRRVPDLLRAVLAETADGAQVLAAAIGAAVGYASRRIPR